MKKFLSLLLALVMCFSLVACGNNDNQVELTPNDTTVSEKSENDKYIGVWETINPNESSSGRYLHQLKVYKGGTGDRVINEEGRSEPIILPFSWEINDDVFNMITSDFGGETKSGFILENGTLLSVNGTTKLKKIDE